MFNIAIVKERNMSEQSPASTTQTNTQTPEQPPTNTSSVPEQPTTPSTETKPAEKTFDRFKHLTAREKQIVREKAELAEKRREIEENVQYVQNAQKFHETVTKGGIPSLIKMLKDDYNLSPAQIHSYLSENHLDEVLDHKQEPEETAEQKKIRELEEKIKRFDSLEEERARVLEQEHHNRQIQISKNQIKKHNAVALENWESDVPGETTGPELLWTTIKKYALHYKWDNEQIKEQTPNIVKLLNDYCEGQLVARHNAYQQKFSKIRGITIDNNKNDQNSNPGQSAAAQDDRGQPQSGTSGSGSEKQTTKGAINTLTNDLPATDHMTDEDAEKMSEKEYLRWILKQQRAEKKTR